MNLGFRVNKIKQRVSSQIIEDFLSVPVANVSDSMSRMFAGGARLRPMHNGSPMAGSAFTVKTRPGDNLMVHLAIDLAEPGDVIVVDAGGDLTNAVIGELMMILARTNRIGGIVINGAIRDSEPISKESFPVFAAGITHRGPYKDGPGEINVPIAIDGMVINPGDIIIGDADGILNIPASQAEKILAIAKKKTEAEEISAQQFRQGTSDRSHIISRVVELGATFEE